MRTIILISAGGCLGAVARYLLSRFISYSVSGLFPWGTFIINITGSFAIGFIFDMTERFAFSSDIRSFFAIGFLGAYTTFSTYALENVNLARDGEVKLMLGNIFLSNIAGIAAVVCGIYASRFIFRVLR